MQLSLPFPGKPSWNVFIEDWPQGFLGFKLLVECGVSLFPNCFEFSIF